MPYLACLPAKTLNTDRVLCYDLMTDFLFDVKQALMDGDDLDVAKKAYRSLYAYFDQMQPGIRANFRGLPDSMRLPVTACEVEDAIEALRVTDPFGHLTVRDMCLERLPRIAAAVADAAIDEEHRIVAAKNAALGGDGWRYPETC